MIHLNIKGEECCCFVRWKNNAQQVAAQQDDYSSVIRQMTTKVAKTSSPFDLSLDNCNRPLVKSIRAGM